MGIPKIQRRKIDKRGRLTTLTFSQEQAILCLYKHNISPMRIAKFFKLSRPAIYYHFKKFKAAGIIKNKQITVEEILRENNFI